MQANTRSRQPVRYAQRPDEEEEAPAAKPDASTEEEEEAEPADTARSAATKSSSSSRELKDPVSQTLKKLLDKAKEPQAAWALAAAGGVAVAALGLGLLLARGRRGGRKGSIVKPGGSSAPRPRPAAAGATASSSSSSIQASSSSTQGKKPKKAKAAAAAEPAKPGPWAKLKPTANCVPLADGSAVVIRRPIAADNSCLFNAVGHCMHHSSNRAPFLRQVVAREVSSDPQEYHSAFLGMSNTAYCQWITNPVNWGGGIELAILAAHYHREIAAWNIETGSVHVFGEEKGYLRQVMVIYNGVHYDALAVAAGPRAPADEDTTEFNPRTKRGKMILAAAKQLVELNNSSNKFLSTSKNKQQQAGATAAGAVAGAEGGEEASSAAGTGAAGVASALACQECGGVVGDAAAAAQHAQASGHTRFAEVAKDVN